MLGELLDRGLEINTRPNVLHTHRSVIETIEDLRDWMKLPTIRILSITDLQVRTIARRTANDHRFNTLQGHQSGWTVLSTG